MEQQVKKSYVGIKRTLRIKKLKIKNLTWNNVKTSDGRALSLRNLVIHTTQSNKTET